MGLFYIPNSNTTKGLIEAAVANIEQYLKYPDDKSKYLLESFALNYLNQALEKLDD